MEHAIKRNFGGLESEDWCPFHEFDKVLMMDRDISNLLQRTDEVSVTRYCIVFFIHGVIVLPAVQFGVSR